MKLSKLLLVLALSGVLLTSCKKSETVEAQVETKSEAKTIAQNPQTASFEITGMTCSIGCAATIQKELAAMDGVESAVVDFDTKIATVKFDADKLSSEKLVETVEATADGKTYKVSNVKASGDHAMLYDNEKEKGKKKKKSKAKKGDSKKECVPEMEAKKGTPACCASKKACHA